MRLEDLPGYSAKRVLAFTAFKIFAVIVQLGLVGLKLTGVVTWNWWWILTPIWAFCAILLIAELVLVVMLYVFERRDK